MPGPESSTEMRTAPRVAPRAAPRPGATATAVAASRTVEDRIAHSLHAYFIRPGDPRVPILYEVDRARDGKSFTTRRVVAIQHGEQIFNMAVSFQVAEEGLEHQIAMPIVPPPATDAAIDVHLAHTAMLPSAVSAMHLYPIDVAIHRKKGDATAIATNVMRKNSSIMGLTSSVWDGPGGAS